jgi:tetratricopeptide (TPR) repeat protein
VVVSAAFLCAVETYAQTRSRVVDVNNTPNPVASLREQIAAAPEASERNRLQLELAELLSTTGNKAEAIVELNKIASSSSFDPVGFYNLGNSFARLGEPDSAIAAYRTAIEQRKSRYSRAYNNLGVMLLRTGKWDEAQEALLSALKIESFRYAEASYNLGRVYAAKGQNDLAAREWRRALVVDPRHDAAKQELARVGKDDTILVTGAVAGHSSTTASKTLELDQISYNYLQNARAESERGKKAEAADIYHRLLRRNNGYFPPANFELSFVLLSLNRHDEALANLLEVSKRDGARYPLSYYHLARLYEMKGELKLAEAAFTRAVSLYTPANPQFLLDLSRVREKLGDFKGSLEAMESYSKLMQERGEKPSWSDERIAELRSKASKQE